LCTSQTAALDQEPRKQDRAIASAAAANFISIGIRSIPSSNA
jgi:hypothetical protein